MLRVMPRSQPRNVSLAQFAAEARQPRRHGPEDLLRDVVGIGTRTPRPAHHR